MKPHLSHSQLEMYWRCPEQYRFRYIDKRILPPGIALIQGKAIHAGAERNFGQKIASYIDMPMRKIVDATMADFETQIAGGYALDQEESRRGASLVIGESKDMTRLLAMLYAQEQAPDYQPVSIEHQTRIELPNATHDLVAITDLIDDKGRITDLKTAKRSIPQSNVENSTQLTIYAAAYCKENGALPNEVRFDILIKTKVPKRQMLPSCRSQKDLQVLANRINVTLAAIHAGNFPPCPTGSWCCTPRWCGYWYECRYVNSERSALADREGE